MMARLQGLKKMMSIRKKITQDEAELTPEKKKDFTRTTTLEDMKKVQKKELKNFKNLQAKVKNIDASEKVVKTESEIQNEIQE